jgi:hypothetical protein
MCQNAWIARTVDLVVAGSSLLCGRTLNGQDNSPKRRKIKRKITIKKRIRSKIKIKRRMDFV